MKQVLGLIFILVLGSNAYSQTGVTIHEDPRIEMNMRKLTTRTVVLAPQPIYIYNIQLISTYDRNEANSVQATYRKYYPGKESHLSYKNPKYIIRVGNYTSKQEAEEALAELRRKFPSAFLLPPRLSK